MTLKEWHARISAQLRHCIELFPYPVDAFHYEQLDSSIRAGETALALETICDDLIDETVSVELYDLIVVLGHELKVDPDYWSRIHPGTDE